MTDKATIESSQGLEMEPDKALASFLQTGPADIPDSAKLKPKKPPPKRRQKAEG